MSKMKMLLAGACAAAALTAGVPANALVINLVNTGGVNVGSDAYNNFRAAANFWESKFTNNVTVTLNVGFTSAGFSSPNIIGQTGSTRFTGVLVEDVFGQLQTLGNSTLDAIAVANFAPTTTVASVYGGTTQAVSAITQQAFNANGTGVRQNPRTAINLNGVETASNREWDNDGSRNNYDLSVNSALLKALGYNLPVSNVPGQYNGTDATITFNSAFNFDFNATDGIGVGQTDFLGTAVHEIGHALGFTSGVDRYDTAPGATSVQNYDLTANMNVLDLFRYSNDTTGVAPGTGPVLDWSVGNAALDVGRPYFSFDGGQTNGLISYGGHDGYFSTGSTNGDGNQASHWRETPYTVAPGDQGPGNPRCLRPVVPSGGIMDPTFAPCEMGIVTSLDMAAFDAMGWNISYNVLGNINRSFTSAEIFAANAPVPEPATWAMMIMGFGLVGGAMRRRSTKVAFAA